MGKELFLYNAYIPEYQAKVATFTKRAGRASCWSTSREMRKLLGAITREGMTLVPLSIFFNARGIAKVSLGIAKGKKLHDKRASEKERDWNRDKSRLMRERADRPENVILRCWPQDVFPTGQCLSLRSR